MLQCCIAFRERRREIMELRSQEIRKIAPELDPLRIGTGWRTEDLSKPQVMIESTYGDIREAAI